MHKNKIGQMVRFHRKKSGLTQEQLGHLAGLGKTVVFDIENGKLSVRFATLLKVLEVLNIKLHFQSPRMSIFEDASVRRARIFVDGEFAGELEEVERGKQYRFTYPRGYRGASVSLEMPTTQLSYVYDRFPPFLRDYFLKA